MKFITTDHIAIQRWIEERSGYPAAIKVDGALRVYFPGYMTGDRIELLDWATFYQHFEDASLAFQHRDHQGDGSISRRYQFVSRN